MKKLKKKTQSKVSVVLRLATGGPLRTRDLGPEGIPRAYLRRLTDRGTLERVARGVYRIANADLTESASLAEVATRNPKATICLLSALQMHGLTTQLPHHVWILIDRKARAPKSTKPKLHVVRASGPALTHGVVKRSLEGVTVRVTTPAKTVADCFRYRSHVGLDVALESLRDYLRKRAGSVDALLKAAKADRVSSVIRPYLEALGAPMDSHQLEDFPPSSSSNRSRSTLTRRANDPSRTPSPAAASRGGCPLPRMRL